MGDAPLILAKEISNLSEEEREFLFDTLRQMYPEKFMPKDAVVVGSNYDFWLNEKDDAYDKL
jgi:hypothetical protein